MALRLNLDALMNGEELQPHDGIKMVNTASNPSQSLMLLITFGLGHSIVSQ
jgi:hypothetical protein